MRTFSKAFALAGARVGYALAEPRSRGAGRRQSPAARFDAVGGARGRGARNPPDVSEGRRGARAPRAGAALARVRAGAVARELRLLPVDDPRRSSTSCCAAAASARSPAAASGSPSATARTTSLLFKSSRVLDRERRRAAAARTRGAGDGGDAIRVRLDLDGAGRVRVADRRRHLRPLPRAARVPRRLRPDRRGRRRPRDGRTTRPRTPRSRRRGARPGARRPARDLALRQRGRGDGRRARRVAVDLGGRRGAEIELEQDPGLARARTRGASRRRRG